MKKKIINSLYSAWFIALVACTTFSVVSCDEGGIDSQVSSDLHVGITAQSNYLLSASVASVKFTVNSNAPWTISSDQSWCTVTPVSSVVSALVQEVTIETELNPGRTPRTATITVSAEGVEDQKIVVEQDARADLNVAVIDETDLFPSEGGVNTFTVLSNKAWTARSDKAWLTLDVSEKSGSDDVITITARAVENTGNLRTAKITVETAVETKEFIISQVGYQLEIGEIDGSTFAATGADARRYLVESNIAWVAEVSEGCDWINITGGASGNGSEEIEITVDDNDARCGERWDTVIVKARPAIQGVENLKIPVRQGKKYDFSSANVTSLKDGSVRINSTGGQDRLTSGPMKLGTYVWAFSEFNIPEGSNACFDLNAWPNVSPSNANFHVWLGPTNHKFGWGPGFNVPWIDAVNIDVSDKDFNELRELKLEVLYDEENFSTIGVKDKVKFRLSFNGDLIFEQKNRKNPFLNPAEIGIEFYFGFANSGTASCTIESFTITPIE